MTLQTITLRHGCKINYYTTRSVLPNCLYVYNNTYNYYSSAVDVAFIVLFSRLEIYVVNKTVGHRRRTVSYIFAFCKDINASSLLFYIFFNNDKKPQNSITNIACRKDPIKYARTQKSGSSKNALYLHLHNGSR